MFSRFSLLALSLLLLSLVGCGQVTSQKTPLTPTAPYNAVGKGKGVVILPFVDYADSDIDSARRRNMLITEALTDTLTLNGFTLPVQEDVLGYLQEKNIIAGVAQKGSLQDEISRGEWSKDMTKVLQNELSDQQKALYQKRGLAKNSVQEIGKYFGADYVMRGRIIEYKQRSDEGWRFWEKGILPFFGEGAVRILFGFIDSTTDDGHSDSFFTDEKRVTGEVEMRVWVQDAVTGEVVWTNHTSIEAARASFFADPQHDVLFKRAAERSACMLVHDFAKNGL